jgi:HlyD family secretion protein
MKMKKIIIISGIVVALIVALTAFNRFTSKSDESNLYAEVKQGSFEITVTASGELIAERSVDIMAPEIVQRDDHGGHGGHGGGGDIRGAAMKIQDLVPEGTVIKEGDFIAQLDRTQYDNTLKDDRERLITYQTNLEMKILDSTVVFNSLRDDIKNQKYLISEAEITLRNSKYESPDIIRQAEIALDKAQRVLEQKERSLILKKAQTLQDIKTTKWFISRVTTRINDLSDLLTKFTITAPSSGMVIYKKDRLGNKRKVGAMISPFDRSVATLPDLTSMISKTYISEIEVNKVKPGQIVEVTIDAFPSKQYSGTITSVANIGEVLPNSDSKVFETLIRIDGTDPALRPSMTTGNKIILKAMGNAVYIPTECVVTGPDSIPFVYTKSRTKQIVIPGESNDKNIIIEKGLKPGITLYLSEPENHDKFKLAGRELIPELKKR